MVRKKYISLGAMPLSISIVDNGTLKSFNFRGGLRRPKFIPPFYVTTDEKEQRLLESSPSYTSSFKLESATETTDENVTTGNSTEPAVNLASEPDLKELTFKTVQAAKDWIQEKFGLAPTKFPNREKVAEFLAEKGYTINFENINNTHK